MANLTDDELAKFEEHIKEAVGLIQAAGVPMGYVALHALNLVDEVREQRIELAMLRLHAIRQAIRLLKSRADTGAVKTFEEFLGWLMTHQATLEFRPFNQPSKFHRFICHIRSIDEGLRVWTNSRALDEKHLGSVLDQVMSVWVGLKEAMGNDGRAV